VTAIPSDITTIAGLARHRLASMSTEELVAGPHELDTRRLAAISAAIAAASAERTRPVAVLIDLDPDGYLLILAALASGRPIVILDVGASHELLLSRLAASNCCCIVTPPSLSGRLGDFDLDPVELDPDGADWPTNEPDPTDPAMICFTSGSTGASKSYARTQGGLLVLGRRRFEARGLEVGYRQLICLSPLFVGVLNNIAQSLAGAASTCLLPLRTNTPERLLEVIQSERINYIPMVPTLFRQIIHHAGLAGLPDSLHSINLSGELMTRSDLKGWLEEMPRETSLHVSYGSTESGTLTIHRVTPEQCEGEGPIELGHALEGVELEIADDALVPCAQGETGWVYARSIHEAVPFGDTASDATGMGHVELQGRGAGWLPMGDNGYLNERGSLVILGRGDGEVKLDGLRFNPVACEAAVRTLDVVMDAVLVMPEREGALRPVLFVIGAEADLPAIREKLSSVSPAGDRVRVVFRTSLPSGQTGKVDRRALKEEASRLVAEVSRGRTTPNSPIESVIQDVWINHLKIKTPPLDRTFLELGGTSVGFLAAVVDLKERYSIELPMARLTELSTIERQAEAARVGKGASEPADVLVEFTPGDATSAFLILPGIAGHIWALKPLWEALDTTAAGGGLDWAKADDFEELADRVHAWAGARTLTIIGFSGGCCVAGELAARLESRGGSLRQLVILDGMPRVQLSVARRIKEWIGSIKRMMVSDEMEKYLQSFRRQGRSIQRQVGFRNLEVPVRLLLSRESSDLPIEAWQAFSKVEVVRCESKHLELVRYPIPAEVTTSILAD
jgi:acyl-coenzyme A synthetase/AMP-(fatty) acid ligase/acyl carrier protein